MDDLQAERAEWQAALVRSKLTSSEARLATLEINQLYQEAAAGRGPGPSARQVEQARHLEQLARDARLIEEAILNRVFGVGR